MLGGVVGAAAVAGVCGDGAAGRECGVVVVLLGGAVVGVW